MVVAPCGENGDSVSLCVRLPVLNKSNKLDVNVYRLSGSCPPSLGTWGWASGVEGDLRSPPSLPELPSSVPLPHSSSPLSCAIVARFLPRGHHGGRRGGSRGASRGRRPGHGILHPCLQPRRQAMGQGCCSQGELAWGLSPAPPHPTPAPERHHSAGCDPCLATDCKYANKFHFHCLFGNCKYVCKTSGKAESHCLDHINPNNSLVNVRDQFAYYSLQCLCPNQHCEFRMRGHYHCLRTGCYFVTNITTKLPWHVKKHEKAERRAANGFKYFTKREECGRLAQRWVGAGQRSTQVWGQAPGAPQRCGDKWLAGRGLTCRTGCKYNQVNSHFHCIREGCQFSFLLKHQMTSHARKHMRRMLGKNFDRVPPSQGPPSLMDTETDEYMDYTGCSPGAVSSESPTMDRSCSSTPVGNESTAAGCPAPPPPPLPPPAAAGDEAAPVTPQPPLTPSFSAALLRAPLPSLPCLFSPPCLSYSLLSATLGATGGLGHPVSSPPRLPPATATASPVKSDVPLVQDAAGNTISMPTASGAKKRFWIIEDMSPFGKRRKTASSRKMLDEGMMLEGFRRFDLYEDCRDPTCQFSLKVTHYHCTRENCGYKFCGRTHMYKHAQHHDRVDNLVLDDFKRFKASLSCHFADCPFSGSSTHFHCLRCRFRCTDSTKVTAHRKHHGKQDVISAAGFCQFSSSADCAVPDCKYKLKCSHFHCTYPGCRHTVVGMSQMDSHKRKHDKQERGEPPAASPGPAVGLDGALGASAGDTAGTAEVTSWALRLPLRPGGRRAVIPGRSLRAGRTEAVSASKRKSGRQGADQFDPEMGPSSPGDRTGGSSGPAHRKVASVPGAA
ncbi:zinc finger protein castor homolog 1-like [Suricata suricatta]|uniref:zinc finger protein castor homolog 1-like n=1 Tax=Suricata suricatta TaxID=37032 RepID=UPI0011556EAE|nr:zinc finger protein castor homolog 1-like [Suricata suricatta]